jgi:type IV pilus assembly protein PilB
MGELVVDLLETTGLIPEAKFDVLREKAKHLPVVQVLIDEGLASGEAIARIVAAQHGLPVVELGAGGIDAMAAEAVPLHVLEQVQALPYAFEGDSLCVAIADPQNIHGIEALRLASRHPSPSASPRPTRSPPSSVGLRGRQRPSAPARA